MLEPSSIHSSASNIIGEERQLPVEKNRSSTIIPQDNPPVDDRLLSHLHADVFIRDIEELNGSDPQISLEYMIHSLNKLPENLKTEEIRNLIQLFEKCEKITSSLKDISKTGEGEEKHNKTKDLVNTITSEIKALDSGQRYLIPGGWNPKSFGGMGHSMLYEIVKQENGKFSFIIYNSGNGINDFHDSEIDGYGYKRYSPIVKRENIEQKVLEQNQWLFSLIDLRTNGLKEEESLYAPAMIYDAIFPELGGDLSNYPYNDHSPMRAQRADVCSWKVLLAFMRESCDRKIYKTIKMEVRLNNLQEFLDQHETLTSSQIIHLSHDIENLHRALLKEECFYSNEQIGEKKKVLQEMKNEIEKKSKPPEKNTQEINHLDCNDDSIKKVELNLEVTPLPEKASLQKVKKHSVQKLSMNCPQKEEVDKHLSNWEQHIKTLYDHGDYHEVIFYTNELISRLPFPIEHVQGKEGEDRFWGEIESDQQSIAIINSLSKINEYLLKSCFHKQECHPKEKLTSAVSYAIQVKVLENMFGYQRSHSGCPFVGLGMRLPHEITFAHINAALERNEFEYSTEAKETARKLIAYFGTPVSGQNAIESMLSGAPENMSEDGKNKWNEYKERLSEKAKDRGYDVTDGKGYKQLEAICCCDMGNFQLCPDFLVAMNKQSYMTSYFFGQNHFSSRGPGSEDDDAFSIISAPSEEEIIKSIESQRPYRFMEVKGAGRSSVRMIADDTTVEFVTSYDNLTLRRLLEEFLTYGYSRNPNKALTEFYRYKDLSPELAQELLTLINTPEDMILLQLLGLYQRHQDLLQTSDHQKLFELIFLKHLEGELKRYPETAKQIQEALNKLRWQFQAPSQVNTYLFLMRQQLSMQIMVGELSERDERQDNLEKIPFEKELEERIERSKDNAERQLLQAQLAWCISKKDGVVNKNNVLRVAKGLSLLQSGHAPKSMLCIDFIRPIEEWLLKNKDSIRKEMSEDDSEYVNELCNSLFLNDTVGEKAKKEWKESTFPIFQDTSDTSYVNVITGEVGTENSPVARIPQKVQNSPVFKKLFGDKVTSGKLLGFNRYTFSYEGSDYRLELTPKDECIIEQKIGGTWFRYLHPSYVENQLPPLMVESHTHWISTCLDDDKKMIMFTEQGDYSFVAYSRGEKDQNHQIISRLDDRGSTVDGSLLDHKQYMKSDFNFSVFEDPQYIHGWVQSGKVTRVEMGRYHLNFTLEDQGYSSEEFKGYNVAKKQVVENLPYLNHYLLLENKNGQKKLVVPVEHLCFVKTEGEPLSPQIDGRRDEKFSYLTIDLDNKGEPKNLDQEKALYLAYLALTKKQYDLALSYIEIAEKKKSGNVEGTFYKMSELVYASKDKPGDNHSKAKALLLRAGILAVRQMRYTCKSSDYEMTQNIKNLLIHLQVAYKIYHVSDKNAGYIGLISDKERVLLQEFYREGILDPSLEYRLQYLQKGIKLEEPVIKFQSKNTEEKKNIKDPETLHRGRSDVNWWCHDVDLSTGKKSLNDTSLTRPEKNFLPYFYHVCLEIDKYTTEDELKKEVERYLNYSKWSATKEVVFLNRCLGDILKNKDRYKAQLDKLRNFNEDEKYDSFTVSGWITELEYHYIKNRSPLPQVGGIQPSPPLLTAHHHNQSEKVVSKDHVACSTDLLEGVTIDELFTKEKIEKKSEIPNLKEGSCDIENSHIEKFNKEKTKFYRNADPKNQMTLKGSIHDLQDKLVKGIEAEEKELKKLEDQLLQTVNKLPEERNKALRIELEKKGGLRKDLIFEDLLFLYLQGSHERILNLCPGLNDEKENSQKLINAITKYLVRATVQHQRENTLSIISKIEGIEQKNNSNLSDSSKKDLHEELNQLMNDLYQTMSEKRAYKPEEHPEYLLFEYKSKFLIREKNIEVLSKLLQKEGVDPKETEVIIQLTMGSGKTKVLLPLLALKNSDGNKLPILVVPPALLETNREDLKVSSKGTLFQEPTTFEFDRNTPFTVEELSGKLWSLKSAIDNRSYVVTTPESLVSAKLKYREILDLCHQNIISSEEASPKLEILEEILNIFEEKGWAIIDEADTLLDVRREVNFPMGKVKNVPKERIDLIKKIYKVLLRQDINEVIKLSANKPEGFRKDLFKTKVVPEIIDHMIKDYICDTVNTEELKQYLCGGLEGAELPGLKNHPKRREIALSKELLNIFLPTVLEKKGNVAFGLSHQTNTKYPIPYLANDTPDEKSEFGNIYETLLYAVNIYAQNGLNENQVEEMISKVQAHIRMESKDSGIAPEKTAIYREFTNLFGVEDIFQISSKEKQKISQLVKENDEALFFWLTHFVFTDITTTAERMNGNALTLIDMLGHVQGFTGTPWNRRTYHERLNKPDREDELSTPESEIRILDAIHEKLGDRPIHAITSSSPEEATENLLSKFSFDCLIDTGAFCTGILNEQIAEKMNNISMDGVTEGTIYFNQNNEIVVKIKDSDLTVPLRDVSMENIRTYYDQRHTTGTDIKQRPKAKALLTYCKNTTRDLTQSAMRMRQLLASQGIEIVIPEEIKQEVKSGDGPVKFEDLVRYSILLQARKLGSDMVESTKKKLRNILVKEVDQIIRRKETSFEDKKRLHGIFREAFIEEFLDDPYLEFGASTLFGDPVEELTKYKENERKSIEDFFSKAAEQHLSSSTKKLLEESKTQLLKELDSFTLPEKDLLPPEIALEQNKQQKNETKVEVQKEVEVEQEVERGKMYFIHKAYDEWFSKETPKESSQFFVPGQNEVSKGCPVVLEVDSLFKSNEQLNKFQGLFDKEFCTTKNFTESVIDQREAILEKGSQKVGYHILFVVEPDQTCRGIMVDPKEASMFRKYLREDKVEGRKLRLVDVSTGIFQDKDLDSSLTEKEKKRLERLLIQAKFINGESHYNPEEQKTLKKWLGKEMPEKRWKELFVEILTVHSEKQAEYKGSPLEKIFKILQSPC